MPELFVGTALPDLDETMPVKQVDDLPRLQDRNRPHASGNLDLPYTYKLRLQIRLAILEKHFDYFAKTLLHFLHSLTLRMGARPTGDVANIQPGVSVSFDDKFVGPHGFGFLCREHSKHRTSSAACLNILAAARTYRNACFWIPEHQTPRITYALRPMKGVSRTSPPRRATSSLSPNSGWTGALRNSIILDDRAGLDRIAARLCLRCADSDPAGSVRIPYRPGVCARVGGLPSVRAPYGVEV
jgi:hypothetical protein